MYTHVVLFRLKDRGEIEFVAETLRSMAGKIPVLKELEIGINDVEAERNYDIVLIARFDSKADLQVYQDHPYHVNTVLPVVKERKESSVAGDYQG